jgi:predicted RNA binding protein YcfA (HicA-like mRNA interferase family)
MSGQHPPITCKDFKEILKLLGFTHEATHGSHEQWTKLENGRKFKVTVDCPKSPFTQTLISSMASQAGVAKKEIYRILATL